MTGTFARALLAAALCSGCAWHGDGAAGALREAAAGVPAPALGMGVAEVLALVRAREAGGVDVDVRELHVSRVTDGAWEALRPKQALRDPGGEIVVIAVRRCGDWTSREHWEAVRASWFVLEGGSLAAFDHWSFGPRCSVGNAYAPAAPELLETERTLRRFAEQRHPAAPPPLAIRFRRGLALLAAEREAEARAELSAGDQGLAVRQERYEHGAPDLLQQETYRLESEELYALREQLSAALTRRSREGAAAR